MIGHGRSLLQDAAILQAGDSPLFPDEILYGLDRLPEGWRRTDLSHQFQLFLARGFTDRVLPFDERAARAYAELKGTRDRAGRPIAGYDAMIAAIAQVHGAEVATRNVKDFEGCSVAVLDPWRG
jgi:predicted nucleic acid-binding protein